MWIRGTSAALAAVALAAPADLGPVRPAAVAAFDRYVRLTEARMAAEVGGRAPFLWVDRLAGARRSEMRSRLAAGEILSAPLETRDAGREIDAPGALIHHWVGAVLLRGVTLARTAALVQSYDRYSELLAPMVVNSSVLSASPREYRVRLRTTMTKVITVVIDADYLIVYQPVGAGRLYSSSVASNFYEVSSAGDPTETRVAADLGRGYLWRLNTYCSFEQSVQGTIEQCESISLTRDVPFGLGWLIGPMVTGIPRDTLAFTLGRVRSQLERQ